MTELKQQYRSPEIRLGIIELTILCTIKNEECSSIQDVIRKNILSNSYQATLRAINALVEKKLTNTNERGYKLTKLGIEYLKQYAEILGVLTGGVKE